MDTKIVSIVNKKGGVGKSLISQLLIAGVIHEHPNLNWTLFDMGEQLTVFKESKLISDERIKGRILPLVTDSETVFIDQLEKASKEFDLIIIDTNSNLGKYEQIMIMAASDLVIVPSTGHAKDLITTADMGTYFESAKASGVKVRSLINKVTNTKEYEGDKLRKKLDDIIGIKPLETVIRWRPAYYPRFTISDKPNEATIKLTNEIISLL